MLHVLTVHWRSTRWIALQMDYLKKNCGAPFMSYAALGGISESFHRYYTVALDLPGTHADKLNALARLVALRASEMDQLMFLDGDAFPIAPLGGPVASMLKGSPLAAIRRSENAGDLQPHPAFCVTTVGFWKWIQGDWRPGYTWRNFHGTTVTDVGGNLLELLKRHRIGWYPVDRTASCGSHPVFFGIYGGCVYHHGAGFREPVSRRDILALGSDPTPIAVSRMIERNRIMSDRMYMRLYDDAMFSAYAE